MKNRLCAHVALFLSVASLAFAQPDMQPMPPGVPTSPVSLVSRDRAEGLIKLDVMVTDVGGKPVAGLEPKDFSLLEEGRQQKILSFDAFDGRKVEAEPPVKIMLLIDTIELAPELARDERLAVEAYLRKDSGHLAHPVSVFVLSDLGLWTVNHPSVDGDVLAREIDHNDLLLVRHNRGWETPGRGLGDQKDTAQESALKALGQIATDERRKPGRKLLVWVGPGWGIGSGQSGAARGASVPLFDTVWWFSTLLREARLVLYSFTEGEIVAGGQLYKDYLNGVRDPYKTSVMNLYRKVLAVQSGGRVMVDTQDMSRQIEECVHEAEPYYRISFDTLPAQHPNEYHDLKVVVGRPGLNARTNTGYYDQPYYPVDPIPIPRQISIEQVQRILELDESDTDKAKQLYGLELTERLSERRLAKLEEIAHGKRTREELRILTDASAFLDPPADEIPNDQAPDPAAQQRMLSLMFTYLSTTIRKLPDLFAQQTTVRYQDTPMYFEPGTRTSIDYKPLHVTDSWKTPVRNRNGFEITEVKPPKRKPNDPYLITYGDFGPALRDVFDALPSSGVPTWLRWEQEVTGRAAVFRYVIPLEKSHFQVWLCCLPDGDGTQSYQRYAGYHTDIAIDPVSGAILRLQLQVDFKSSTPVSRSGNMIEYGPVEIGGKTYVSPLRGVSIMRARSVRVLTDWDEMYRSWGPYSTMLNDMSFDRYHMFRSESHVLPGFAPSQ
jgi:VWFA-related protein